MNASIRDFALELRRLGLSVFPVVSRGKEPCIRVWTPFQQELASEEQIREWYPTGSKLNVAVVCGAVSKIVVVDVDSPEAERWAIRHLPPTPRKVRTYKGSHWYYGHPGGVVRNAVKLHTGSAKIDLDVKGDGGYVVGPGSTHKTGFVYRAIGDWSAPPPLFDPAWTRRPVRGPSSRYRVRMSGDVIERARAYLSRIPRPVIGQGSDVATFIAAAHLVRGFCLAPETAVALLVEWSGFDRWWVETKVASAQKNATEPEGALLGVSR